MKIIPEMVSITRIVTDVFVMCIAFYLWKFIKSKKEEKANDADGDDTAQSTVDVGVSERSIDTVGIAKTRRRELLSALKPYVSEKRAGAIDSIVTIADILDAMRSK